MITSFKLETLKALFLLTFLVSCSPPENHGSIEPGCNSSGTVQSGQIENARRGYTYTFKIYLPPCYKPAIKPGYPVVYLVPGLGGSINVWYNVEVNEIADQLIIDDQIPPFIIVTTESSSNDPYVEDIYSDLIPYIDRQFNTLKDRNHRAVAGGSLGGIAAYRLVFQYPDEFASVGIFGSGVINGENEQVKNWLAETSSQNRPRVFINVGEQDPLMLDQAYEMTEILKQYSIPYEFIVEDGDHSYAYWATNMKTFFRWVALDW